MKITVDVDCTPEEARRFMGLPDLQPLHDSYIDKMRRGMDDGVTPESLQAMLKTWAPMGETGMMLWRQLVDQVGGAAKPK